MTAPLEGHDAPSLTASGQVNNPEQFRVVPVTGQDGKVGEVYAHELPQFIAGGGHVATKGELGNAYRDMGAVDERILHNEQQADIMDRTFSGMGIESPALKHIGAGILGASDMGTAGIIPAISGMINGNKEATAGLFDTAKEAYPVSSGAGGALGVLLASRYAPGSGAAGAGRSALSTIGRSALTAGVDNAIYGGTNYITDSYLRDRDLSLDKLIYHAGMSGLVGAGVGAGFGVLGKAAEFALPKVGSWVESNASLTAPTVKQASKEAAVADVFGKIKEAGINLESKETAAFAAKKVRDTAINDIGEIFNKQKTKASVIDTALERSSVNKTDLVDSLTSEAYDAGLNNEKVRSIIEKSVRSNSDAPVTLEDLWEARSKISAKASPEAAFVRAKLTNQAANDLGVALERIGQPELASKLNGATKAYNLGEAAVELTKNLKDVPQSKSVIESLKERVVSRAPWALAGVLGGHLPILTGAAGLAVAKDLASAAIKHAIPTAAAGLSIGKAVTAAGDDIASQVGKFINGNKDTGKQKWLEPKYTRADYDRAVKKYQAMSEAGSHPVVTTLSEVDPALGKATQQRLTTIANNVVSRAQAASPGPGGMPGVAGPRMKQPGLNAQEMSVMRYIHAIEEPASILRLMRVGALSSAHVDAIKENMPALYNEMVNQITSLLETKVGSKGKGMTLSARSQLSLVLGKPVDYTTSPQFINAVQSSFIPAQPPNSASPVQNGAASVDSTQYETGSEKVEK